MKAWPLFILAALAIPAWAGPRDGLKPVDQAVADLDPLARSYRQMEAGLRYEGEQRSRLFTTVPNDRYSAFARSGALGTPVKPQSYRIGKGFVARVDRINYLMYAPDGELAMNVGPRKDGQYLEMIGPNTVFELRPIDFSAPPAPPLFDARINARVEPRRIEPRRLDNRAGK